MSIRRIWLITGFMWVAYFLNYCDRQVVFSVFPILRSELRFTDTQLGLTSSVFLWVYSICSPIAGQIADWASKRILIILSLILWSGVTVVTGWSNSVLMMLVCRALIGVTESLFLPAAIALTASLHGPQRYSLAVAIIKTGGTAGVVMGGWFGGFMAEQSSWRHAFYVLGGAGILFALPYWSSLRGVSERRDRSRKESGRLALVELARVPSFWFVCAAFAAINIVTWFLYTWLPNYFFERFSLSLSSSGFSAVAYLQSGTVLGMICGGAMSDWLYKRTSSARFWVISAGLLFSAPFLYMLANASSASANQIAAIIFGLGNGLLVANVHVCCFDVIPIDTRASAIGFFNLVSALAGGFAALLGGMWKESLGFSYMMSCASLVYVVTGCSIALGTRWYFQRDFDRAH